MNNAIDASECGRELPSELTIYTAAETHGVLLKWLDQDPADKAWAVSAQAVSQVDAAGLQLLVSLQHSLRARGQQLRVMQASEALRKACLSLGLMGLLHSADTMEVAA